MTGAFAEFFADLREALKDDDPLVDLRTLPPEVLRPIQPQIDAWLNAPQSERRCNIIGIEFTIRRGPRGPMVRYSKLLAVYAKFTELAAASERAAIQQIGQIEAESSLTVATGRADNLKERITGAMEGQAVAERRLDEARAEIASLKQHIEALTAEKHGADKRIHDLAHDRDILASELQRTKIDRDERLQKMLAIGNRIAERSKQEISRLQQEIARLHQARDERAGLEAEIVARANRMLADNEALDTEVQVLDAKRLQVEDELRRCQEHARRVAKVAARFKRERDASRRKIAALKADKEVLEYVNWWLQEKLRFRGRAPHAA